MFQTSILPKFANVFRQVDVPNASVDLLPWLVAANQVVMVTCVLLLILVLWRGTSSRFGAPPWRFIAWIMDRVALRVPLVGKIVREGSLHQFSVAVGLFLRAGASLPEAVQAAASAERNSILRKQYEAIAARVGEGGRLSEAKGIPADFIWFVESGEASGELPDHLLQASVHYETRLRFGRELAMRSLVPILMIVNGALVLGTFMVAIVPVWDLALGIGPW